MEFLKIKDKEKKIYSIQNEPYNKYLVNFLSENNFIISLTTQVVNFQVDSLETLENQFLSDTLLQKFIYDLGFQILYLKEEKLGISYFDIKDILVINKNCFLFINPNKLFTLLNKKDINFVSTQSYEYGIIDSKSININSLFLAPELKNLNSTYIYFTCSFYSFVKLLLYVFDLDLQKLYHTSIYFFSQRCLLDNPEERIFLYV